MPVVRITPPLQKSKLRRAEPGMGPARVLRLGYGSPATWAFPQLMRQRCASHLLRVWGLFAVSMVCRRWCKQSMRCIALTAPPRSPCPLSPPSSHQRADPSLLHRRIWRGWEAVGAWASLGNGLDDV